MSRHTGDYFAKVHIPATGVRSASFFDIYHYPPWHLCVVADCPNVLHTKEAFCEKHLQARIYAMPRWVEPDRDHIARIRELEAALQDAYAALRRLEAACIESGYLYYAAIASTALGRKAKVLAP